MEQASLNKIYSDLEFLKEKIINIELNMVDMDRILTVKDEANLNTSLEELERGDATSLEDFEKEMKENVRD